MCMRVDPEKRCDIFQLCDYLALMGILQRDSNGELVINEQFTLGD